MKNKYLIFYFYIFLFCYSYAFSQNYQDFSISHTGVCYDNVNILEKKVKIQNPIPINYDNKEKLITFEQTIPRYMKIAGYWISKIEEPDKVILTKKEIKKLNNEIYNLHLGISNLKNHSGKVKQSRLEETFLTLLNLFIKKKLTDINGEPILPEFFIDLYDTIDIPQQDVSNVRYAITTAYNDVRLFPTDQKIISLNSVTKIDRLQEESIDIGTPVIVLCQTTDSLWSFVTTETEEGWIKTENIAFTNKKTFNKWIDCKKVVITDSKADIFLDKEKTDFLEYARMGAKFPYISKKGNTTICIKIPIRDDDGFLKITKGYLDYIEANIGFLKYTQRNALNLAFNQINSPYGWGGADGEQDCSGYLGQIYSCFGILLPETSVQKIKCGTVIKLNKQDDDLIKNSAIIDKAMAGISFIYLPGHIMLYIGEENNKPYVIHSVLGLKSYNEKNEKAINYINKTIVSDLEIGDEFAGNSLIDRTSKFNIIK